MATLGTLAVNERAQKILGLEALVVARHVIDLHGLVRFLLTAAAAPTRRLVYCVHILESFAVPIFIVFGNK